MIRSVQTQNFRMLPANRVSLSGFQVLVGQNATGKSTFLGVLQLVSRILQVGVSQAVAEVASSFYDLCFDSAKPAIAFALELSVERSNLRYEIEIGIDQETSTDLRVVREALYVLPPKKPSREHQASLFGLDSLAETPTIHAQAPRGWRRVVGKTAEGKDYFRDERTEWNNVFRFGPDRAALGSLPEDPDRFPISIAVRNLLRDGIRPLALEASKLRAPSPAGSPVRMALDGSNLPFVVRDLRQRDEVLFHHWVAHVAAGVPGLMNVKVREREEDRSLFLEATFSGQHPAPVPSWLLSDGTLRLMALTLVSYAASPTVPEVYVIEEPENGLHPLAVQVAHEALSSAQGPLQILCATHSPIFLAQVVLQDVLVFRRGEDGFAIVRHGSEVPELAGWSGRVHVPDLFVAGVLA